MLSGGESTAACFVLGFAKEDGEEGGVAGARVFSGVGTGDISDGFGAGACRFFGIGLGAIAALVDKNS